MALSIPRLSGPQGLLHNRYPALLFLLLLAAALMAAGLGLRAPSNVDEERFIGVALEMLQSGDWLVPHRAGEIYPDKPPLFMWSLASLLTLGIPPFIALFLPAVLASMVATACLYDLGRRLWNPRVGLYAGLLFLAVYQTFSIQRAGQIDGFLLLWTALGLYGLLRHLLLGPAWGWFYLACAAMGFGIISKGVGFLPALLLIPYAFAVRYRWHGVVAMPGKGKAWALGLLVTLLAISCWLLPVLVKVLIYGDEAQRAYLQEILFKQTAGRYANAWHHREPFWFFFTNVIPKYWIPLVFLLPWLLPAWRRQLAKKDGRYLLLLGWVVLVLIFFSLSTGKRKLYIFPALPALVLATAPLLPWLLQRWLAGRPRARTIAFSLTLLWFGLWFARGFAEPLLEGDNANQVLMSRVAEATNGSELVLTGWREGHWLYARQPLVHFGKDTPDTAPLAAAWLRSHPDAWALLLKKSVAQCFHSEQAQVVTDAEGEQWYLVRSTADNGQCKASLDGQRVWQFQWQQPVD